MFWALSGCLDAPGFEGKKQVWCFFDWIRRKEPSVGFIQIRKREINKCYVSLDSKGQGKRCGVSSRFEGPRKQVLCFSWILDLCLVFENLESLRVFIV